MGSRATAAAGAPHCARPRWARHVGPPALHSTPWLLAGGWGRGSHPGGRALGPRVPPDLRRPQMAKAVGGRGCPRPGRRGTVTPPTARRNREAAGKEPHIHPTPSRPALAGRPSHEADPQGQLKPAARGWRPAGRASPAAGRACRPCPCRKKHYSFSTCTAMMGPPRRYWGRTAGGWVSPASSARGPLTPGPQTRPPPSAPTPRPVAPAPPPSTGSGGEGSVLAPPILRPHPPPQTADSPITMETTQGELERALAQPASPSGAPAPERPGCPPGTLFLPLPLLRAPRQLLSRRPGPWTCEHTFLKADGDLTHHPPLLSPCSLKPSPPRAEWQPPPPALQLCRAAAGHPL